MIYDYCVLGGEIVGLTGISESVSTVIVSAGQLQWEAAKLVVWAGLQSDCLARRGWSETKPSNRALWRRILSFAIKQKQHRAASRLSDSGSEPPFSQRSLDANDQWSGDTGSKRGTGFARENYRKLSFSLGDVSTRAFLAFGNNRSKFSARTQRNEEFTVQKRLSREMPQVLPKPGNPGSLTLPSRHSSAGGDARRLSRSRFFALRDRPDAQRLQCVFACGDVRHSDRRNDRL
jgi:hypothetical protein